MATAMRTSIAAPTLSRLASMARYWWAKVVIDVVRTASTPAKMLTANRRTARIPAARPMYLQGWKRIVHNCQEKKPYSTLE